MFGFIAEFDVQLSTCKATTLTQINSVKSQIEHALRLNINQQETPTQITNSFYIQQKTLSLQLDIELLGKNKNRNRKIKIRIIKHKL